jgi:hypothetical protein
MPATPRFRHAWQICAQLFSFAVFFAFVRRPTTHRRARSFTSRPNQAPAIQRSVEASLNVSSLKDFGKLMAAEVDPMFAQMERTMHAQGRPLGRRRA